jgi:hypothetical protein
MNVELVAQMFKNYQSNVLFHLEGTVVHATDLPNTSATSFTDCSLATDNLKQPS